jgi:Carbohydrate family 9 binding domain-like
MSALGTKPATASKPAGEVREQPHRDRGLVALAGLVLVLLVTASAVRLRDTAPAYVPPRHYLCYHAGGPIVIDGKLDEPAWAAVPWTEPFVDIEGDRRQPPRYRTRAKMLWDDRYFYVAAEMEEPHVWATLTEHDSVIFHDNDFEVFLDPDGDNHNYGEFEINALNTGWDLRLPRPYKDGGQADDGWEIPGLKTAVHVDGTLNDPRDTDRGWTVEIAFPWQALGRLSKQPAPPRDGDQWRVNFSRVEWRHTIVDGKYRKESGREDNWVWSPQGVVDMHRPETWGYVQFSTAAPGRATFRPDPAGPARHLLHRIYYAQREYHKNHGRYARALAELGLAGLGHETLAGPPQMETTADGFRATVAVRLPGGDTRRWRIRQDSLVGPLAE